MGWGQGWGEDGPQKVVLAGWDPRLHFNGVSVSPVKIWNLGRDEPQNLDLGRDKQGPSLVLE